MLNDTPMCCSFRLPIPEEVVERGLRRAYEQQVAKRGLVCEGTDELSAKLKQIAGWLTGASARPGLLLYGGVGNGKTTMARAIASYIWTLCTSADELVKECNPIRTTEQADKAHARIFDAMLHLPKPMFFTANDICKLDGASRQNLEKGFLIVDDLGCEPSVVNDYGTRITPVLDILLTRYGNMNPTIATTNLSLSEMGEIYGERALDRFNEVFARIGFCGGSFRGTAKRS